MSLYRTYRPKNFADVAGQSHIVSTLEEAVKQDKLSHAYLFAGTRGTGKTSIARILAKIILTRGVEDATLRRQIGEAVDDGSLVDLTEIDAASNRGIDDIRSLLEKIQFTPVVSTAKVFIIDEVHMLTREAFNALLKTLEEPPPYAYFILATTELHKIPATIQSRCQRFLFRQIREEDIVGRLRYIADQEKIDINDEALTAIARHVGGSMRDAISLLDQLRSLPSITLTEIRERIGESGHAFVEQTMTALESGDRAALVSVIESLEETGVPMEQFVRMLLADIRIRLHAAVAANQNTSRLQEMLRVFLEAAKDLRIAPVPGLVLESALLSLSIGDAGGETPHTPAPPSSPTQTAAKPAPPKTPKPAVTETKTQTAAVAPSATAPSLTIEEVSRVWPDIVQATEPPFVRMSLKNGQLARIEGNTIVVRFTSTFHRDKASSGESGSSIEDALENVFHRRLKVSYILDTETVAAPSGESVNVAEAALEIF